VPKEFLPLVETEIKIRNAEEKDFLDIMSIAGNCEPMPVERDSIYHDLTRYFTNTCFIAEREGKIVGYLLGWISQIDGTVAYIHNVCVVPGMRRRQVATGLYNGFFETVEATGCNRIFLIVSPRNKISLDFHRALGFEISEEGEGIEIEGVRAVRDYNGPEKHMVVMCRQIRA